MKTVQLKKKESRELLMLKKLNHENIINLRQIDNFSNPPPSIIKSIFITKFVDNEHNKTRTLEKWEYIGMGFRILRYLTMHYFSKLKTEAQKKKRRIYL